MWGINRVGSIKEQYRIIQLENEYVSEWILNKHYAKRICSVSYAFGLFNEMNILVGVCTFGFPPNYNFNGGKCVFKDYEVTTLELNRLITDDGLPENTLSYFVSQCLKHLPRPLCVVSYADPNNGHYGYIYQATNWIYTGNSTAKTRYYFEDGESFDIRRGIDKKITEHGKVVKTEQLIPTQRYIYFNGNKKQVKEMKKHFKLENLPYPKGQNRNYDAGYKCRTITVQDVLGFFADLVEVKK